MEQGKYCCDGGCVVVKIGGKHEAFKFESDQEFEDYLHKNHILEPYYKGSVEFYNAEVLDYDCCGSDTNTLFKLKGRYFIYTNNRRSGDIYFVKKD